MQKRKNLFKVLIVTLLLALSFGALGTFVAYAAQYSITVKTGSEAYVEFQDGYVAGTPVEETTAVKFTTKAIPVDKEVDKVLAGTEELTAAAGVYTVMPTANKEIEVVLKDKAATYKLDVKAGSEAYIEFQGGYVAGTAVAENTEVKFTIKAIPADKELDKVLVGTTELAAVAGVYTVKLDANKVVEVVLKDKTSTTYKLDVKAGSEAYIEFQNGYVAGTEVAGNTEVKFTIKAIPADKELDKVLVGTTELTAAAGVYTVKLDANKVVEVVLKDKGATPTTEQFKLEVSEENKKYIVFEGGYVAGTKVDKDTVVKFTISGAPADKYLDIVSLDHKELEATAGVYSVKLDANKTVDLIFSTVKEKTDSINQLINTYKELLKNYQEGDIKGKKPEDVKKGQVLASKEAKETLDKAIAAAETAAKKEGVTFDEAKAALKTLQDATKAFDQASLTGTKEAKSKMSPTTIAAIVILVIAILVPAVMSIIKKVQVSKAEKQQEGQPEEDQPEENAEEQEDKSEETKEEQEDKPEEDKK